ncbi:MAG: glycerophosphodiester phosphodiesterase [Planctomycetota bacterium]
MRRGWWIAAGIAMMALMPVTRAAPPIVIAHRGASGYLPEHTLPAKALAVGQGADYVEQDVVATRDGVPVVLHDIHLDGVSDVAERFPGRARADGRFYCADFTLAELKSLAIVERFDHRDGAQIYPGRFPKDDGRLALATLEEELRFLAGLSKSLGRPVGIYPEIKQPAFHRQEGHDLARSVLDLLARSGYATRADRCYVQCFDPAEVRRIRRELGWQGNLVQLVGGDATELVAGDGLARIAEVADGLGPALELVIGKDGRATDLVERAHAAGLVVHPWTARRDALPRWAGSFDELMERLGGAGVDGVFTDFPDLAVAWRARQPGDGGGR